MIESVQPSQDADTLAKRPYGYVCWSCRQESLLGYVWLRSDAQNEDLQRDPQVDSEVGCSVSCKHKDSGHECGAANHITRDQIVLVDESLAAPDRLADRLSME
jgi:hypothetical protein